MTALALACLLSAPAQSPVLAWNALARDLARTGEAHSFETFALLSVAGWRAWVRAEAAAPEHQADPEASARSAMAAASAAVLLARHPDASGRIGALRKAQGPEIDWASKVGAAAATDVLALSRRGGPKTETSHPGGWTSAKGRSPIGREIGELAPWVLESPGALRPAEPPAMGSPPLTAALAETRALAAAATDEQIAKARYWAGADSGNQTPALWNEIAATVLDEDKVSELQSVRMLALMNAAMHEAAIGCFEAKYWYVFARPSQLDSKVKVRVSLPNFPSYPSAHGCFSGAASAVLGAQLPARAAELSAKADEAALSRVWAGLHFRFDGDAGLKLGQGAAARVMAAPDKLLGP